MSAEKAPHQDLAVSAPDGYALPIIEAYRESFSDETRLYPLDMEFPYLNVGDENEVYILDTSDNEAGTFKWRGALVGAVALKESGVDRIVVPSAGNHGRGAVLAAKALDMSVDVVVPSTAPPAKREGLSDLWADPHNKLHVSGSTFDESLRYARKFVKERGGSLLHPYDDKNVMTGQGTIVDDLLASREDVNHIVSPVGGGGLLAGIADRLREHGREDIRLTAVQAPGSDSLERSIKHGKVTSAELANQRYGGSAVKYMGRNALESVLRYPNLDVVSATEEDIAFVIGNYDQSRNDFMRTEKYFVPAYEPTSLVAVAGLMRVARKGEITIVLGTGHNAPLDTSASARSLNLF